MSDEDLLTYNSPPKSSGGKFELNASSPPAQPVEGGKPRRRKSKSGSKKKKSKSPRRKSKSPRRKK